MTHLALRLTARSEVRTSREGPFGLYQAYLESVQTLHEIEVWSTANVLQLQGSSLYHVADEMIADLYALRPVVEYRILCHLYAALVVT
jgi:hypothetical protein